MCFDRDFFNLNYCVFLSIFEPQPCSTFIPTLVSISHASFFHFSRCQCRLGYFGAVSIILQSIIFIADRVSHCAPFHSKLCGMWLFIFTLDSTGLFSSAAMSDKTPQTPFIQFLYDLLCVSICFAYGMSSLLNAC